MMRPAAVNLSHEARDRISIRTYLVLQMYHTQGTRYHVPGNDTANEVERRNSPHFFVLRTAVPVPVPVSYSSTSTSTAILV